MKKGTSTMKRAGILLVLLLTGLCSGCSLKGFKDEVSKETSKKEEKSYYSPIEVKDVKIPDVEYPYEIKVNRAMNCVTVYTMDEKQEYTVPVRAMICSTGGDKTPLGNFQLGDTNQWLLLSDGTYCQYATRIVDNVLFHSVPYLTQNKDSLDVEAFNRLGETVSSESIWLEEADAEWISQNCAAGTCVEIYEDKESPGPLGKPDARLIAGDIKWDPTDTSSENAWYVPVSFTGIKDIMIKQGTEISLLEGITAKDKKGNDLTGQIEVLGKVDVNTPGDYTITYTCKNSEGVAREVKAQVVVEGTETTSPTETSAVTGVVETSQTPPSSSENTTEQPTQTEVATAVPTVIRSATPEIWVNTGVIYIDASVKDIRAHLLSHIGYRNFGSGFSKNSIQIFMNDLYANTSESIRFTATNTDGKTYSAYATVVYDCTAPQINIVAESRYTPDISTKTLAARIQVKDAFGVDATYVTTQYIQTDESYVVIYEAVDKAGNRSCVSEKVFISN